MTDGVLEVKGELARYRVWLTERPLARSTRVSYGTRVSTFVRWVHESHAGGEASIFSADPDWLIQRFVESLEVQGYAPRTINGYLAAILSFFGFLGLPVSGVTWQRNEGPSPPRTLSSVEQRRLLWAANARGGARDSALVALGLFAGLRLAELTALDVDDVELSGAVGHVALILRSGHQMVPLNAQARAELATWLAERQAWRGADDNALWLSQRGRRLSVRGIDLAVRSAGAAAGLEVSTGVLRHTFIANLLRVGADIAVVAELAGHRRTQTTRRYAPIAIHSPAAAVEAVSIDD